MDEKRNRIDSKIIWDIFEGDLVQVKRYTIGLLGFGVYHDSTYFQILSLVNILLLGVIFIHKKDN